MEIVRSCRISTTAVEIMSMLNPKILQIRGVISADRLNSKISGVLVLVVEVAKKSASFVRFYRPWSVSTLSSVGRVEEAADAHGHEESGNLNARPFRRLYQTSYWCFDQDASKQEMFAYSIAKLDLASQGLCDWTSGCAQGIQ